MVQGKWKSKGLIFEDRADKVVTIIMDLMRHHKEVRISQVDRHIELAVKGGPPDRPPPEDSVAKRLF